MHNDGIHNRRPVLVLGIGNILLRDEGIGVHVIKTMENASGGQLPDYVELLDGGTAGADLLEPISDRQKLIVIDAVDAEVEPGNIMRLLPQDLDTNTEPCISMHEFGLVETLTMAKHLNCSPQEVVIIAVKPEDLNCGLGLSEKLERMVPKIIECVLDEIKNVKHLEPSRSE
jgi:hydrogenase maturation protease